MTGKAGEEGHIRPKRGTDVMDRAGRDVHGPVHRQPRRDAVDPAGDAQASKPATEPTTETGTETGTQRSATREAARAATPRIGVGVAGTNPAAAVIPAMPGAPDMPAEEAAARPAAQRKGKWQWQPEPRDAVRVPATEWKLAKLPAEAVFVPGAGAPVTVSVPRAQPVPAATAQADGDASYGDDSQTLVADGHGPAGRSGSAGGAPIFVDPSGRRASRIRRMGWLVAAGCVCSVATLGVAVTDSNSTAPWLRIPGMSGSAGQNRSAKEAPQPERQEPGTPTADDLSSTIAEPPNPRRTETTTAAEAMNDPRPDGNGTRTSPGSSSTTPPSTAGDIQTPLTDNTETAAGQPSQTTPPDTVQEPTAAPTSATPSSPSTPTEPAPTATPATGLLDGLVDAVSGLLGG
ncbi:hypothetical protein [Streptomyces sp. NPDC050535]|uniref:hypothetical protein n=1 Tax=Streptomyces sp. NPDC050535 TaxID=3365626 RepID=UPI003792BB9F